MKTLGALIGYASTATVITLAIGMAYLWSSSRLDDEKVFRMVALLHDVDIESIANEAESEVGEVPPEEPSPEDVDWQRQVLARNHEVKMEALKRNKLIFDASLKDLVTNTDRFHDIANKLEKRLLEDGELANKQNLQKVVQMLELQKPDQAKDEIMNILEDQERGTEDVIRILNTMAQTRLKKIIQQFQNPKEKAELHRVLGVLLDGGLQRDVFENALEELNRLKSQ